MPRPARGTTSKDKDVAPTSTAKKRARSTKEDSEPRIAKKVANQSVVRPNKSRSAKEAFHIPFPFNRTGDVFVVGSGDCGQLGLGPDVLEKERPALLQYFRDKKIVAVYAGGLHNIALDSEGKLYSWGCNDQKALGRDGEETEPGPVEGLDGKRIVMVACGDSITAALTDTGEVYAWGTFRCSTGIFGFYPGIETQDRPFLMKELKNVIHIAAGANHLVAVTKEGKMFTWGVGEQGQLGHRVLSRHAHDASLIPRSINFYPKGLSQGQGRRAKRVFDRAYCGGYCTYLVHQDQAVFAYGLNNYGQLGVGETEETVSTPMRVVGFDESSGLKMIAGGEHHAVLLDGTGTVYAFGRGDSGQLGLGDTRQVQDTPIAVPSLSNARSVSANGAFSLAVTNGVEGTAGNNFYTWGYGDMGQLCNQGGDELSPYKVDLKGREVVTASAGGQHIVFLVKPKAHISNA